MDKVRYLQMLNAIAMFTVAEKSSTRLRDEEDVIVYVNKDVLPSEEFTFIDDTRKKSKGDKARARSEWKHKVRNIRK